MEDNTSEYDTPCGVPTPTASALMPRLHRGVPLHNCFLGSSALSLEREPYMAGRNSEELARKPQGLKRRQQQERGRAAAKVRNVASQQRSSGKSETQRNTKQNVQAWDVPGEAAGDTGRAPTSLGPRAVTG